MIKEKTVKTFKQILEQSPLSGAKGLMLSYNPSIDMGAYKKVKKKYPEALDYDESSALYKELGINGPNVVDRYLVIYGDMPKLKRIKFELSKMGWHNVEYLYSILPQHKGKVK